jgi:hypothetical protein
MLLKEILPEKNNSKRLFMEVKVSKTTNLLITSIKALSQTKNSKITSIPSFLGSSNSNKFLRH